MTCGDLEFVKRLFNNKLIKGPILELGAGYSGPTCRDMAESFGCKYFGTDLEPSKNVDFVGNFENDNFNLGHNFSTILVLNVLEHTFDPIKILDNCIEHLNENGKIVIITPSIWQIHNYPIDCNRLLPNFYQEYAKRRGLKLNDKFFEFVGFGPVNQFLKQDGSMSYPPPIVNPNGLFYGKVIHKVFNTFGRGMAFPSYVAIGCLLEK